MKQKGGGRGGGHRGNSICPISRPSFLSNLDPSLTLSTTIDASTLVPKATEYHCTCTHMPVQFTTAANVCGIEEGGREGE